MLKFRHKDSRWQSDKAAVRRKRFVGSTFWNVNFWLRGGTLPSPNGPNPPQRFPTLPPTVPNPQHPPPLRRLDETISAQSVWLLCVAKFCYTYSYLILPFLFFRSKSAIDSGRFWMECLNGLTNGLQARTEIEEDSKKKFETIVGSFNEMVEKATIDFKNRRMEKVAQMNRVLGQWELTKRDLFSEIGIWAKRLVNEVPQCRRLIKQREQWPCKITSFGFVLSFGLFFTYVHVRMLNTRQWTNLRVLRTPYVYVGRKNAALEINP